MRDNVKFKDWIKLLPDEQRRLCSESLKVWNKTQTTCRVAKGIMDATTKAVQGRKRGSMTDREKAIVMAHTGICMLTGDKFQIFHKYVEDIMGRPIWTHEMGLLADTIKEKSKADFIALCADESCSELNGVLEQQTRKGQWIKYSFPRCGEQHYQCTSCGYYVNFGQWGEFYTKEFRYCPNCGCRMVEPQESEEKK